MFSCMCFCGQTCFRHGCHGNAPAKGFLSSSFLFGVSVCRHVRFIYSNMCSFYKVFMFQIKNFCIEIKDMKTSAFSGTNLTKRWVQKSAFFKNENSHKCETINKCRVCGRNESSSCETALVTSLILSTDSPIKPLTQIP